MPLEQFPRFILERKKHKNISDSGLRLNSRLWFTKILRAPKAPPDQAEGIF